MKQIFDKYLNNQVTKYYIDYFKIKEHEFDILWIVDAAIQATLPVAWESQISDFDQIARYWQPPSTQISCIHPIDSYLLNLSSRLRSSASRFQPMSLLYRLTLNPPSTIKDILLMCGYLGIDPQSGMAWLAMVCLCCDVNHNQFEFSQGYILTERPQGAHGAFEQNLKIPQDYYRNRKTKEKFTYNPIDFDIYQLTKLNLISYGSCVFPKLSQAEQQPLQAKDLKDLLIFFDFSRLETHLISPSDLSKIKRLKVPEFEQVLLPKQYIEFVQFLEERQNLQLALQKANDLIFNSDIAQAARHVPKPMTDAEREMLVFNFDELTVEDLKITIPRPDEFIEQNFVISKPNQVTKKYLDLEQCAPMVPPDPILNMNLKINTKPVDTEDDEVCIWNLRSIKKRPARARHMFKAFHGDNYEAKYHQKEPDYQKAEQYLIFEYNFIAWQLQFTASQLSKIFQNRSDVQHQEAQNITRALADDNVLQQILKPPPPNTKIFAILRIPQKQAKAIYERVSDNQYNGIEEPVVDTVIAQEFKHTQGDIELVLTVHIRYGGKRSSSSQASTQVEQQVILTECEISYSVNDHDIEPPTAQYKQTVCDFCIGYQLQIGDHYFVFSRIDAATKQWLQTSLELLKTVQQKLEKELLYEGMDAFLSQIKRFDADQLKMCEVSLRVAARVVLKLFVELLRHRPEIRLAKFL